MINGFVTGAEPRLDAEFPQCTGGLFIAEKKGYMTGKTQHSTRPEDANSVVTIYTAKLQKLRPSFRVLERRGSSLEARELRKDESALITITNDAAGFEEVAFIPADNPMFADIELPLFPMTYNVSVRILRNNSVVGGAEYSWSADPEKLANAQTALFFGISFPSKITDPESPEWKFVMRESRKHKVNLI